MRFDKHQKSTSGFGRLGVFLTLDQDLAEHYGTTVIRNKVTVTNPLLLYKEDDSELWAIYPLVKVSLWNLSSRNMTRSFTAARQS